MLFYIYCPTIITNDFSEKIVNVLEEERLFKEKELEQLEKKIAEV